MDGFREELSAQIDALLERGVSPMFLVVDLVGAETLRRSRDASSLDRFRESCLTALSSAANDAPAFSYGDIRIVAVLSGYDRLKTFALVEKMHRVLPLLSQSYDCIIAPEFDTLEYDEQTGISGIIAQITAPRRHAEAA